MIDFSRITETISELLAGTKVAELVEQTVAKAAGGHREGDGGVGDGRAGEDRQGAGAIKGAKKVHDYWSQVVRYSGEMRRSCASGSPPERRSTMRLPPVSSKSSMRPDAILPS